MVLDRYICRAGKVPVPGFYWANPVFGDSQGCWKYSPLLFWELFAVSSHMKLPYNFHDEGMQCFFVLAAGHIILPA